MAILLISISGICAIVVAQSPPIREEPGHWRDLAQFLQQKVHQNEPLIFSSGEWAPFYNQSLYLGTAHYSTLFPRAMVMMSRPMEENLRRQLKARIVWLVMPPPAKPETWMPGCIVLKTHAMAPFAICYRVQVN